MYWRRGGVHLSWTNSRGDVTSVLNMYCWLSYLVSYMMSKWLMVNNMMSKWLMVSYMMSKWLMLS